MKRLFVDMDGVLADYESGLAQVDEATLKEYEGHSEQIPGLYSLLPPERHANPTFVRWFLSTL